MPHAYDVGVGNEAQQERPMTRQEYFGQLEVNQQREQEQRDHEEALWALTIARVEASEKRRRK